ncbi:SRPBCC family protein [Ramlibacter sp. USB13]|uniref:SRPBCC family protein n=1 Tax=Ramlibacter cellulosilyticus TaxID=2764187 RepID=A0A923SBW0_9BURK|nr:SRPBCC family protein [Ramlibacter cellulosilyticus]MBC5783583.1 SRPBCC family protein [Ramlibacter cellulosilyticus]
MATIRKDFEVPASAEAVWAVVREFGGLVRLAPGFVGACAVEEGGAVRLVTFANGMQVRERLVTLDDAMRRLAYTAEGGRASHYNGVVHVQPLADDRCRFEWTVDLLPDALAVPIGQMMAQGSEAMRSALTPPAR